MGAEQVKDNWWQTMIQREQNQSYVATRLNYFSRLAHNLAIEAGWAKEGEILTNKHEINTALVLIHSEISEAAEGVRKDAMDDHLPHRKMVEVELADAFIRIANLAGCMGLDLGGAVAEKLAYNATRQDHSKEAREAKGGKSY